MGNGNWSQNYSVTLTFGFKPRFVFIFMDNLIQWSDRGVISTNTGANGYGLYTIGESPDASSGFAPTESSDHHQNIWGGVWFESLSSAGIFIYKYRGSDVPGVEVVFSATDIGFSWKLSKPSSASRYPDSTNDATALSQFGPIPEYAFNVNGTTYRYIAFG